MEFSNNNFSTFTLARQGTSHKICQDATGAFENDRVVASVLCDGVSEGYNSHILANHLTAVLPEMLAKYFGEGNEIAAPEYAADYILKICRSSIKSICETNNIAPETMACTLLCSVVFKQQDTYGKYRAFFFQIGDGSIIILEKNKGMVFEHIVPQSMFNSTYSVREECDCIEFCTYSYYSGHDFKGCLMSSDGIDSILCSGYGVSKKTEQFYNTISADYGNEKKQYKSVNSLLDEIIRNDASFDDDISLACIYRKGEEISLPEELKWKCRCGKNNLLSSALCECGRLISDSYPDLPRGKNERIEYFTRINSEKSAESSFPNYPQPEYTQKTEYHDSENYGKTVMGFSPAGHAGSAGTTPKGTDFVRNGAASRKNPDTKKENLKASPKNKKGNNKGMNKSPKKFPTGNFIRALSGVVIIAAIAALALIVSERTCNRIKACETDITALQNEYAELHNEYAELKNEYSQLENEYAQLKEQSGNREYRDITEEDEPENNNSEVNNSEDYTDYSGILQALLTNVEFKNTAELDNGMLYYGSFDHEGLAEGTGILEDVEENVFYIADFLSGEMTGKVYVVDRRQNKIHTENADDIEFFGIVSSPDDWQNP